MKKFTVLMLAALLVVAFAMPASALENIFGGYWQTRFAMQKNFTGEDGSNSDTKDITQVDTRTRIYYTAKLNDNLKLVNKFEMDTVWGNTSSAYANIDGLPATGSYSSNWGDAGADGVAIEIKNSYADFNVGPVNFLVGVQNFTLGRGFITNDDASGMKAIWKVNNGLYLPFVWKKDSEGGAGTHTNEQDIDSYVFAPIIFLSKDIKISPYYAFMHSKDARLSSALPLLGNNMDVSIIGLDFDAKMGAASFWFTGIMQTGNVSLTSAGAGYFTAGAGKPAVVKSALAQRDDLDFKGWLIAAGGKFDLGKADIHGQAFYATGDDKYGKTDKEINGYFTTSANDYHWAEILGGGLIDNMTGGFNNNPTGSANQASGVGYRVSNIMAVNLGTVVKPMDKLSITADLWWAKLAEGNSYTRANGTRFTESDLGLEADIVITYKLVEGLNLDIIGAYLFAGDAISVDGKNNKDPYELGTRLSLSF